MSTGIVLSLGSRIKLVWVLDKKVDRQDYRIYLEISSYRYGRNGLLQVHQYPYHSSVHQEQNVPLTCAPLGEEVHFDIIKCLRSFLVVGLPYQGNTSPLHI